MRVCIIATEIQGIGAFGGFGVLTHDIAVGLAQKGINVYVVIPRQRGQEPLEVLNGIKVLSYPSELYVGIKEALPFEGIYRMIDADIYHSQEPSVGTLLAERAQPYKKHVVTFQDPRSLEDWRKQWYPTRLSRWREMRFLHAYHHECGQAARRAHALFCQAKYIIPKAKQIFRLAENPGFLPNPVRFTPIAQAKAKVPTVCFIGRWDTIKRPELFIELATKFPQVNFILTGDCANNPHRSKVVREQCQGIDNLKLTGWLSPEQRDAVLDQAWILANTSTKECLPVSYLEAAAHKCAILSHGNADEFASKFGFWVEEGTLDGYVQGLTVLLANNRWVGLAEQGYEYVRRTHEFEQVINQHIEVYQNVLRGGK